MVRIQYALGVRRSLEKREVKLATGQRHTLRLWTLPASFSRALKGQRTLDYITTHGASVSHSNCSPFNVPIVIIHDPLFGAPRVKFRWNIMQNIETAFVESDIIFVIPDVLDLDEHRTSIRPHRDYLVSRSHSACFVHTVRTFTTCSSRTSLCCGRPSGGAETY